MSSDNDDDGPEPADYATPLSSSQSSPPSTTAATHDTSRSGYHMKDLEAFAACVETAANRAFPNRGRPVSRYKNVRVLLLRWDEDDLDVSWEVEDLEKAFKSYGFDTEIWLIPTENSHLKLMIKAAGFVESFESSDTLFIVYYGGHATINTARQSTWSCKRNIAYASLEWSAIQTLFEKAKSDVLLLLDCCSAASAAPIAGRAIIETIAACGWESIAPEPGRFSFTDTLIKVLEEWINRPFTAAMLHSEILSRLKHERPERVGPRPVERRRTPIYIVTTADIKACSIQLSKLPNLSQPVELGAASVLGCPEAIDELPGSTDNLDVPPDLKATSTEGLLKYPHVLVSLALEGNQVLDGRACGDWLAAFPGLAKFAKVESVFKSYSTLLLISIPVLIWDLLPSDLACSFVGYVCSADLLKSPSTDRSRSTVGSGSENKSIPLRERPARYSCQNCKLARVQCDRKTPCERCSTQVDSTECIYEMDLQRINQGLEREIMELKIKEQLLQRIFDALSSDETTLETLERIRSGQSHTSIFRWLNTGLSDPPAQSLSVTVDHKRKRSAETISYVPFSQLKQTVDEKDAKRPTISTDPASMITYASPSESSFGDVYSDSGSVNFSTCTSPSSLPLLQIPTSDRVPGLSHTQDNSPWASSISESLYSAYSARSDGSRPPRSWSLRSRTTPSHPSQFGSILEQFDVPTSGLHLDVPGPVGQYNEPKDVPTGPGMSLPKLKGTFDAQKFAQLSISSPSSSQSAFEQLQEYISMYWQSFNPLYPIIHRRTFNAKESPLLAYAMAAIGTQYSSVPGIKENGTKLNEFCKKSIDLLTSWTLETMQAIFLVEIFTRFRGRQTSVRCSRHFKELCNRLSQEPLTGHDKPGFTLTDTQTDDALQDIHEWSKWLWQEQKRRLQGACFVLDIRQSAYHEQSRINRPLTGSIFLPCRTDVWEASSAQQWIAIRPDHDPQPVQASGDWLKKNPSFLKPEDHQPPCPFSMSILIASLATQLPERDDPTYPNDSDRNRLPYAIRDMITYFPTYEFTHVLLSLYNTPLHDLLAIAGDSWVFGEKIPIYAFQAAQARLKVWSSSLAAAAATKYACHFLDFELDGSDQDRTIETACISGWWAMYVSALICWAFGHRFTPRYVQSQESEEVHNVEIAGWAEAEKVRLEALRYTRSMLGLKTEDLLTSKAVSRGKIAGVISAVRMRLEKEAVGGKAGMLLDAVTVLKRIDRGGQARWF